jgi:hypothetical protein
LTDSDETRGLLGMFSQALSRSKDPFNFATEPVQEDKPPPETDGDATSSATEPAHESADSADAMPSAPADQSPPVEEPMPNPPENIQPRPASSYRVSVDEAREIVLRGLRRLPDFPTQGVEVTLYGSRPWNAMLTFSPGSTSHRNATVFRAALADMVIELRKQIDINHGD